MKIRVKQEHIKKSQRRHATRNPIVLAVKEHVSKEFHHVWISDSVIVVDSRLSYKGFTFKLPAEAVFWLIKFDEELEEVKPFTFELEGF